MEHKYPLPLGYVLKGGENNYTIVKVLGKGGFGVTYKVKSRVIHGKIPVDVFFAVKEYFPDICSREADNATIIIPETKQKEVRDGIKDFIIEGRRLHEVCDLNPNIVNVNEVFEANGTAYYVMEYLEGGDLRKRVRDNGMPLSGQQMLDIMRPIGEAVQCLHEHKILHLDIKPDNIVMRRNEDGSEEPVLIDFGIAVHFKNNGTPTSKNPSQGVSPGYSPVEQYFMSRVYDPRYDVYAFCATCLYLLTGKDPEEAQNMSPALIRKMLPKDLESRVADAIVNGMSKDKDQRTGTMKQLLDRMKTVKLPPPPPPSSKSSPFKKFLSYFGMFLLGVLCASLAIWGMKACKGAKNTKDTIEEDSVLTFKVNGVEFDMVLVEGGTFTMGATSEQGSDFYSNETPTHSVTLSPYYIGQTEVTQELWEAVMGENPSWFNGYGNSKYGSTHSENYGTNLHRPVEQVSWKDCQEFIRKLNEETGKNFRLPTEAEWEYAARGGSSQGYKYSGSNNIDDVACYTVNSRDKGSSSPDYGTHPVASKRANQLGIYDMSGNVWEWCQDNWYNYNGSFTGDASYHVLRGGSWFNPAKGCRVSVRVIGRDDSCSAVGLRLVLQNDDDSQNLPYIAPPPSAVDAAK
ncbi:MAG: SUMF1/EgtB/PvdO family nonheme iron enzyme [Muribaculaceae bacterium]|nr:SUMF1/EgtB/PvdO family nonheme iron enzyme [Muribaculaceae bacterium]